MELIFINPCGEFRGSPKGPVNQIHAPHLHVGVTGIFSDLLKVCSDDKERVGCGKHLFIPSKTAIVYAATLVPEFEVGDLPLGRTAALVP